MRRWTELPVSTSRVLALLVLALGVILRLAEYITNRSLWFDEALLALNINSRTFAELVQPLNDNQGAPLGFLLLEKSMIQTLGNRDYVLRLMPFLAGCATLLLIYELAETMMPGVPALWALALAAFSEPLIYYSTEVKQYSGDVIVGLSLYIVATRQIARAASARQFLLLAGLGTLALWFSHSAAFILGGIGLTLAAHLLIQRDRRRFLELALISLWWALNLCALYWLALQTLTGNSGLVTFWQGAFMPLPPWNHPAWFIGALLDMFTSTVGPVYPYFAAGLATLGLMSLWLRRWQWALLLSAPLVLVLLASGLQKYPFSARLILFLAPNVILCIAAGLECLRAALERGLLARGNRSFRLA